MIAAERTGRQAVLLEIGPAYVDVIVRRWEEASGQPAILDGDDRTLRNEFLHQGRQQPDLAHLPGPKALRHAAERITARSACRAPSPVTRTGS